MNYKQGDQVAWVGLNRAYTGVVVGYHGPYAIVKINGSSGLVLLQNEPIKQKRK